MLFTVHYASDSLLGGDLAAIEALKQECVSSNGDIGVTGCLYYDRDLFFQALEGDYQSVMSLLGKILRDPRHANVRILSGNQIEKREFGQWSMKFVSGIANSDLAERFSKTAVLAQVDGYINPCCLELHAN